MTLDARHRSSIYSKLVPLLGEDDANALMTEFPSTEADELVTRQFLRAELGATRSELLGETAALRSELRSEMAELRNDLTGQIADVRVEMAELRVDVAERFRQQTVWLVGAIATATAIIGTLTAVG